MCWREKKNSFLRGTLEEMNRDELDRGKEGGHGAYKGDDGLSDAERIAYAVCNAVSLFVSSHFFHFAPC